MELNALRQRMRDVRRRLLLMASGCGLLWALTTVLLVFVVGAWLDLLWELPAVLRIGVLVVCALAGVGALLAAIVTAWRECSAVLLARRIDRVGGSGGVVLTGWELSQRESGVPEAAPAVSRLMAQKAVARAALSAAQVTPAQAVSSRSLRRSLSACLLLVVALGLLAWAAPGLAATALHRFFNPYGDIPPFTTLTFQVSPGDTHVRYGDGLEIVATIGGAPVDRADLVLRAVRSSDKDPGEAWPMFSEAGGKWRTTITRLTENQHYFIRTQAGRSRSYSIEILTVPRIESVRVRITPPAYTGRAISEGPLPKEGLVGLSGTKVEIHAASNRPLADGQWSLKQGDAVLEKIALRAAEKGDAEVAGTVTLRHAGKFLIDVRDIDGQRSLEPVQGAVTLLNDERPFVRIVQPREMSLATPTARLPVELIAEDDYGISRLQVFRSLNQSRPLPTDLPLPQRPPTRWPARLILPLAHYGLVPGDEIKLFARVEDNDPAGAKGSESKVVTVRIISQEQFEQMQRQRQGLTMLISKYRQAQRRLENLAKQIDQLRHRNKPDEKNTDQKNKLKRNEKLSDQERRELKRLTRALRDEQKALALAAGKMLPNDLDENLDGQLQQLSDMLDKMASDLEDLERQPDLDEKQLDEMLDKLGARLSTRRADFKHAVIVPLEDLARLFPLIEEQSRFERLVAQQRDLAERMRSLRGLDHKDDPALKARMRELETQQRQIREALDTLLEDISNTVKQLPERKEYERLKESFEQFVSDVRASGAIAAMSGAEEALTEFAGTRAQVKSLEAAEILEKFLDKSKKMGDDAEALLLLIPGLGTKLGDCVAQLLGEMGLGRGNGRGGSGSGSSARTGGNVGLYGSLPTLGEDPSGGGSDDDQDKNGISSGLSTAAGDPASSQREAASMAAGGANSNLVPLRYRQRVGQYLRRIAEEADQ